MRTFFRRRTDVETLFAAVDRLACRYGSPAIGEPTNPRERGRQAAVVGEEFHANPYPLGTLASREWSAGHREMMEARG